MSEKNKTQKAILEKLGIETLNDMQRSAHQAFFSNDEVILLSPTGTGKTLAFLLPIIATLDTELEEAQALILVPSRELAIQIEQVAREMGSGYKVNAVYGGRALSKDKQDLKHPPGILIGTPGRIADHIRRETLRVNHIKVLVLDEFDKSLETGFENDMQEIVEALPHLEKKVLTSATQKVDIPEFVGLTYPQRIDFLEEKEHLLTIRTVASRSRDKIATLVNLLGYLDGKRGILFCNFKETIQELSDALSHNSVSHTCFYGGMEQQDRERSLIKFRNGTHNLLVATDLAARGIDVPALDFIIHYQLPFREEEFIHRNGRTARMHQDGIAYLLHYENAQLPDYVRGAEPFETGSQSGPSPGKWATLFISGGRRDKISKGDIAGLFFKEGGLADGQLGTIELKQECAFAAVPKDKANELIEKLNNSKLKKRKVRIYKI